MLKKLRWFFIPTFVILVIAIIVALFIFLGPIGRNIAMSKLKKVVPELSYESVSGSIFSSLHFKNIAYNNPKWKFKAASLDLNMSFIAYARHRRINIKNINITQGSLSQLNTTTAMTTTNNVITKQQQPNIQKVIHSIQTSPYPLQVKQAQLNNFAFYSNKKLIINIVTATGSMKLHQNIKLSFSIVSNKPIPFSSEWHATGTWNQYQFNGFIKDKYATLNAIGNGNMKQINSKLTVVTQGNTATGKATVAYAPKFPWNIELKTDKLALKQDNIPLLHQLNLQGSGDTTTWKANATLNLMHQSHAIKTQITATHTKGTTDIHAVAQYQKDRAIVDAIYKKIWQLKWNINIAHLKNWIDDASGSINSTGTLQPSDLIPISTGTILAQHLKYKQYTAQSLKGTWNIHLFFTSASSLNLTASVVNTPFYHADSVGATLTGTLNNQSLSVVLNKSNSKIQIGATAERNKLNWTGQITQWSLSTPNQADWHLQMPANFKVAPSQAAIPKVCWTQHDNPSPACAAFDFDHQQWNLKLKAPNVYLSSLLNWIMPSLSWTGYASIDAYASGHGKQMKQASLNVAVKPSTIVFKKSQPFEVLSSHINLKYNGTDGLKSNITIQSAQHQPITAMLNFPNYHGLGLPKSNTVIEGNFNWQSPIAIFEYLFPTYARPAGNISAKLNIAGTLAKPALDGYLKLMDGAITIPEYGITIKNINTKIMTKNDNAIINITGYSDGKPIHIDGQIELFPLRGNLKLTANDVLIWYTPSYIIYATPDLNIKLRNRRLDLSGNVLLPKGVIRPPNFRGTLSLPHDVIFSDKKLSNKDNAGWLLYMNMKLTAGKALLLKTVGLTGRLVGSLIATQKPNEPILATGQMHLAPGATFSSHGKTLPIINGSLIYNHMSFKQPSVNLQAAKVIHQAIYSGGSQSNNQDLTVGVQVTGRVKNPTIRFYSSPIQLTQGDILSYLLLGQPVSSDSKGNLPLLMTALKSLKKSPSGDSNIGGLHSQTKQGLGFSELGLESQNTMDSLGNIIDHNTSVVIGKYLSPKLYLRYSIGVIIPVNIFELKYLINKHWSIQTSSSSLGSGIDLIYSIERN